MTNRVSRKIQGAATARPTSAPVNRRRLPAPLAHERPSGSALNVIRQRTVSSSSRHRGGGGGAKSCTSSRRLRPASAAGRLRPRRASRNPPPKAPPDHGVTPLHNAAHAVRHAQGAPSQHREDGVARQPGRGHAEGVERDTRENRKSPRATVVVKGYTPVTASANSATPRTATPDIPCQSSAAPQHINNPTSRDVFELAPPNNMQEWRLARALSPSLNDRAPSPLSTPGDSSPSLAHAPIAVRSPGHSSLRRVGFGSENATGLSQQHRTQAARCIQRVFRGYLVRESAHLLPGRLHMTQRSTGRVQAVRSSTDGAGRLLAYQQALRDVTEAHPAPHRKSETLRQEYHRVKAAPVQPKPNWCGSTRIGPPKHVPPTPTYESPTSRSSGEGDRAAQPTTSSPSPPRSPPPRDSRMEEVRSPLSPAASRAASRSALRRRRMAHLDADAPVAVLAGTRCLNDDDPQRHLQRQQPQQQHRRLPTVVQPGGPGVADITWVLDGSQNGSQPRHRDDSEGGEGEGEDALQHGEGEVRGTSGGEDASESSHRVQVPHQRRQQRRSRRRPKSAGSRSSTQRSNTTRSHGNAHASNGSGNGARAVLPSTLDHSHSSHAAAPVSPHTHDRAVRHSRSRTIPSASPPRAACQPPPRRQASKHPRPKSAGARSRAARQRHEHRVPQSPPPRPPPPPSWSPSVVQRSSEGGGVDMATLEHSGSPRSRSPLSDLHSQDSPLMQHWNRARNPLASGHARQRSFEEHGKGRRGDSVGSLDYSSNDEDDNNDTGADDMPISHISSESEASAGSSSDSPQHYGGAGDRAMSPTRSGTATHNRSSSVDVRHHAHGDRRDVVSSEVPLAHRLTQRRRRPKSAGSSTSTRRPAGRSGPSRTKATKKRRPKSASRVRPAKRGGVLGKKRVLRKTTKRRPKSASQRRKPHMRGGHSRGTGSKNITYEDPSFLDDNVVRADHGHAVDVAHQNQEQANRTAFLHPSAASDNPRQVYASLGSGTTTSKPLRPVVTTRDENNRLLGDWPTPLGSAFALDEAQAPAKARGASGTSATNGPPSVGSFDLQPFNEYYGLVNVPIAPKPPVPTPSSPQQMDVSNAARPSPQRTTTLTEGARPLSTASPHRGISIGDATGHPFSPPSPDVHGSAMYLDTAAVLAHGSGHVASAGGMSHTRVSPTPDQEDDEFLAPTWTPDTGYSRWTGLQPLAAPHFGAQPEYSAHGRRRHPRYMDEVAAGRADITPEQQHAIHLSQFSRALETILSDGSVVKAS